MKLKDLASKPQLVKITLDDEDIVKEYGEPLEFYTWDKQPMNTFLKIAKAGRDDLGGLVDSVKDLIMDEEGNQVIQEGVALPGFVLVRAINKIVETLGK